MISGLPSATRPPARHPAPESAELLRQLGRVGEVVLVFRCGFFNLWRRCRLRGFGPVANSRKWRDEGCGLSLDQETLRGVAPRGDEGGALRCELRLRSPAADVRIWIKEMEGLQGFVARQGSAVEPACLTSRFGVDTEAGCWLDESLAGAAPVGGAANPPASWFSLDAGEGGEVERVRFGSKALDLDVPTKLRVVDRDGPILRLADAGASTVLYLPEPEHGLNGRPVSPLAEFAPEPSSTAPARRSLFQTFKPVEGVVRHSVSA